MCPGQDSNRAPLEYNTDITASGNLFGEMELLFGPWVPIVRTSQESLFPLDFGGKKIAVEMKNLPNIIKKITIIFKESLFFYLE
jgi:hypothetical protein